MSFRKKLLSRMEKRVIEDAPSGGIEMLKEWEIEHVSGAEWVLTHSRFERSESHYRWINTYEWREISGE